MLFVVAEVFTPVKLVGQRSDEIASGKADALQRKLCHRNAKAHPRPEGMEPVVERKGELLFAGLQGDVQHAAVRNDQGPDIEVVGR